MSSSSSEAEFEEEEEDDKDDGSYKANDGGGGGNDDDEEDDEEEVEAPREGRKRASRQSVVSYAEDDDDGNGDGDDDDDSSDDDMPLAQLAAKLKKPAAASSGKKAAKKAAAPPAKKKKTSSVSSSASKNKAGGTTNGSSSNSGSGSSNKTYEWASAALYQSNCDKGRLIQAFLCRWWYAYTWPDPKTLPSKPPVNYDCLDGFPGVYVCTAGDAVGKILDKRDASQAPSFTNMAKKQSSELQEMLLKALERQKAELIEHEGAGTNSSTVEKDLDALIKWTKRVNPEKADREAKKVLQASKIKL